MKEPYKPFDMEHARAGAPYCCADGQEATIIKWDARYPGYPLLGTVGPRDEAMGWRPDGVSKYGKHGDLVMLPLGYIDRKPVFVGDELADPSGAVFTVGAKFSGHLAGCTWPAPSKVYPETRMTGNEIDQVWQLKYGSSFSALRALANAALRHAIDAGQVVPREMLEKVARAVKSACVDSVDHQKGNITNLVDIDPIIKSVLEGKA